MIGYVKQNIGEKIGFYIKREIGANPIQPPLL